jgi:hypothetical protein
MANPYTLLGGPLGVQRFTPAMSGHAEASDINAVRILILICDDQSFPVTES